MGSKSFTYPSRLFMLGLINCLLFSMLSPENRIANAQDESKEKESPDSYKLTGTVEALNQQVVTIELKDLSPLKLKTIASHGTEVSAGDVLVKIDPEPIDRNIRQAERDLRLAEISFETAAFANEQAKAEHRLDLRAAERTWDVAKETYKNFMDVDRDRSIESAKFSLKTSLASLMNAKEELKQLEQMYKEDDLTEESEEIVLKRAKQAVESAEFRHQSAKTNAQRTLEQQIPRNVETQKDTLDRAELAYKKALSDFETEEATRQIELDKKEEQLEKQRKDFEQLLEQRAALDIKATQNGYAIMGELQRGKFPDKPPTFEEGDTVTHDQVLLTIVDPSETQIRVAVPEALINKIKVGDQGTATFTALPKISAKVTVKNLAQFPFASNQYDCVLTIEDGGQTDKIRPMMSSEITFEPSAKVADKPILRKRTAVQLKKAVSVQQSDSPKQTAELKKRSDQPENNKEGSGK